MLNLIRAARILVLASVMGACTIPYAGGARSIKPAQVDAGWLKAAPTPVIKQKQQADCGLAALAMVGGAWGRTWSVDELARRADPGTHGVKLRVLRDVARERGLDAYAIAGTRDDLRNELAQGRPVLLGLILPHDMRRNRSHYEVAIAMNPADGTVVTIDPATGKWMRRSPAVLDLEWKASGYAALVVVGDKQRAAKTADAGVPR